MISLWVGSGTRPSTRLPKQNLPLVALIVERGGGDGDGGKGEGETEGVGNRG